MKFVISALLLIALTAVFAKKATSGKASKADLTNYISYPECCDNPNAPDHDECDDFNACQWKGQFAFVDGQQSLDWVKNHNIIAVHEKFANKYALKKFRITQGNHQIEATVYDECSDSDCDGCCTENMQNSGFLIDMEKYTLQRFGGSDGVVTWECLDC